MIYIPIHFNDIKIVWKHIDVYVNMAEFKGLRFWNSSRIGSEFMLMVNIEIEVICVSGTTILTLSSAIIRSLNLNHILKSINLMTF